MNNETNRVINWLSEKKISYDTIEYLLQNQYDQFIGLNNLDEETIREFQIAKRDQDKLLKALNIEPEENSDDEDDDDDDGNSSTNLNGANSNQVRVASCSFDVMSFRWTEFGKIHNHGDSWPPFFPVEHFGADSCWAWNPYTKSQAYKSKNTYKIWNQFKEGDNGWLLGPPVLLPESLSGFKITPSLRIRPEDDDSILYLVLCLVKDKYNLTLQEKLDGVKLKFVITCNFVLPVNGIEMETSIVQAGQYSKLHSDCDIKIPASIINLKKPPIIKLKLIKKYTLN